MDKKIGKKQKLDIEDDEKCKKNCLCILDETVSEKYWGQMMGSIRQT